MIVSVKNWVTKYILGHYKKKYSSSWEGTIHCILIVQIHEGRIRTKIISCIISETERGISHLQRQLENREKELNSERNLRKKLEKQFEKKTEKKLINELANNKPYAYF